MPVKTLSTAELNQLTPAENGIKAHVAAGHTNQQAPSLTGIKATTVSRRLKHIGDKLGATGRTPRVHAALSTGQVSPPSVTRPAPDFTDQELLLRAVAEHSEYSDIATATSLQLPNVTALLKALLDKAEAIDTAHLVGLGHAWKLLGPGVGDGQ
ncbi:DNA-binding protein [Streptomyces sp. NPDC002055]|uniref:helix-turn-helix transcriptional regulator n=1 Tax=Streptomyces sp. NPDC002055 TaxID=3154534 RepID=UPI00332F1BBE